MTFFRTNNSGMLSRCIGQDVYAQMSYASPIKVKCAVVALAQKAAKTSVRTDQSGSRGNVEEITVTSKILFQPKTGVSQEDKFVLAGFTMRVTGVHPQFDILGAHDHDEVMLEHLS